MLYMHNQTGFPIADPDKDPLAGALPPHLEIENAYRSMIISASGWRKVFAPSGNEEDASEHLSRPDAFLIAIATEAFWRERQPKAVAVGMDTRPTGPAIADIVCRILLAHQVEVKHLFIAAAPEIMAYSAYHQEDHFFYISASHNPIGHNGFKFGCQGGVADSIEATKVIATFRTLLTDGDSAQLVKKLSASVKSGTYLDMLRQCDQFKADALVAYERLVLDTATESEDEVVFGDLVASLRHDIEKHPIGIVAELNGSARSLSIDRPFLEGLEVKTRFVNAKPRQIVHAIVPEGANLEMCRKELEMAHAEDPAFVLGYVPDNDGDRGNIVYYDERTESTRILGAQELFALVAQIELSLSRKDGITQAIVINGPTSLMIDHIAAKLQVKVFRAEVGEANVVKLAQQIRSQGFMVRLLGEGSNGGNITHPSKVRDPLNTLVSLVKLLSSPTRFSVITGADVAKSAIPTIAKALDALPKRTITGGFSTEATMRITSTDHGLLKAAYERHFVQDFAKRSDELAEKFGIYGWREEQTEGTTMLVGLGPAYRTAPMRGGLKIVFSNQRGIDTDFIWMRGSGTEPVFRIMADAMGDDQGRHDYLLAWQRSLVERADAEIALVVCKA